MGSLLFLPSMVIEVERPTDTTPGICSIRRMICSWVRIAFSSPEISPFGIETRNVRTSSGRTKPGWTFLRAWKVRIMSPELINRTNASAIWETASALRARCRSLPSLNDRPPSLRADDRSGFPYLKTGTRPKRRPASIEIPAVNKSTAGSMDISSSRGILAGLIAIRSRIPAYARKMPRAPPMIPSVTLSNRSSRAT